MLQQLILLLERITYLVGVFGRRIKNCCLLAVLTLGTLTLAHADDFAFDPELYGEELAPGYNQCMENSQGETQLMLECETNAQTFWEERLSLLNIKRRALCNDASDANSCNRRAQESEKALSNFLRTVALNYPLLPAYKNGESLGLLNSTNSYVSLLRDCVMYLDLALSPEEGE